MKLTATILAALAVTTLAGCGTSRSLGGGGGSDSSAPSLLPPAPAGTVQTSQLPPPQPGLDGSAPMDVLPTETAAASGAEVTRQALVGAWQVSTAGSNCQMFMALTQWTGGYRAASRGCSGDAANVTAWDVTGNQVVLSDSGGNRVASLNNTGGESYAGTTSSGQSITFTR